MLAQNDLIEISDLFAAMAPEGRALVAVYAEKREFAPGALVFRQGDETDGLYVVRTGELSVVLNAKVLAREIASIGPGSVLGEMSIIGRDHKRKADAIAGPSGASLIFIPLAGLRELRARFPADFAEGVLALAGEVVERLDRANHTLFAQLSSERSESLRRDLVMHDLRSPLALIESGVHSILQRPEIYGPVVEGQKRALARIERNVVFLRLLVDSIMELERTRMTSTTLRTTSLREVLVACASPLAGLLAPERWLAMNDTAPLAFLQGTRLVLRDDASLDRPLRADPLRLAQVLLNLVGNAIRYTTGPVELQLVAEDKSAKEGGAAIELSDNGAGIPPEMREQIFDAFKQRELQDKKLPVGKGFGLAGVREMVSSMGGSICVLDRRDGKSGARFRVELANAPP